MGPRNGARVVAKAWTDPAFRARLLENATAAVAELGYGGPEGGQRDRQQGRRPAKFVEISRHADGKGNHADHLGRQEAGRRGCDDSADPGAAAGGARLSLSGARASAAALARDLGQAQQQLAAVHGGPAPEEEGESS